MKPLYALFLFAGLLAATSSGWAQRFAYPEYAGLRDEPQVQTGTELAYVLNQSAPPATRATDQSLTGGLGQPYPNPANQFATLQYELQNGFSAATVRVYDMLGKEVEKFVLEQANGSLRLSVKNYQPGIYFCSLEVAGKIVQSRKLIVSR
ncbi:MAG: T9SS type A sorting domain-containing protein [Bacteroidetes bacterium]|jgi:hypothetical protein|nr:T9SS type A sorting domain-containing protein [Bacteroidota bacterium]